MSDKKKILIVTQEMSPYIGEDPIAKIASALPKYLFDSSKTEIRILMPRFGSINERRHRLHEVVRLSGINIIIAEDDYPLIIKVASLPGTRMQVYFLDNEDFFKRKFSVRDGKDKFYGDNSERMIFFCKGVLETVKKFGWAPDVIHCHGWMSSLIPLYVKTAYKADPLFDNAKVIYSVYENSFEEGLGDNFLHKAQIKKVEEDEIEPFEANNTGLNLGGIHYADAIIKAEENLDENVLKVLGNGFKKPVMEYPGEEENYLEAYKSFYTMLLEQ